MLFLSIVAATTSKRIPIFIRDSAATAGQGLTGLVFNSSGLVANYWREDDGNVAGTSITLQTATKGTWVTGGFIEKDATNLPGFYELGIPDAVLATGAKWARIEINGTGLVTVIILIEITAAGASTGSTSQTVSDTITLDDSIATLLIGSLDQVSSDSLALTDSIATIVWYIIEQVVSDALAIFDSITTGIDYALTLSDSLVLTDSLIKLSNSIFVFSDALALSDSIVLKGDSPKEFSDRLTLTDLIFLSLLSSQAPGDTLAISDSIGLSLGLNKTLSDSLSLSDSIVVVNTAVIEVVVGDVLNLTDSLGNVTSTNLGNYLRDYLNDVEGVRTPEVIITPADESPGDFNEYIRRYLNDVT